MTTTKLKGMPPHPKRGDPDYQEKLRPYAREWARRYNATPEGKAANKKRKDKYRSKPGVREEERKTSRARARKLASTEEGRAHLRESSFKFHHGVTRKQADATIAKQKGLCAICSCPAGGKRHCSRLHVDHCHETGKFRGMLCSNCNKALGHAKDNSDILRKMADYLDAST